MKRIRLEKINGHLQEESKNKKFRKAYEVEVAKVSLAQKIAELREENHLNQGELAKKFGVSQQFISQIVTYSPVRNDRTFLTNLCYFRPLRIVARSLRFAQGFR